MEGGEHTLLYIVGVGMRAVGRRRGRKRGRKSKTKNCQSNWVMLQSIGKLQIGLRSSKFQAGAGSRTRHDTVLHIVLKRQVRGVPFPPPLVPMWARQPDRLTQLPDQSREWLLNSTSLGFSEQGSTQHTPLTLQPAPKS